MKLSEMLLPEFEREMANTRRVLERVPDEKFAWKPHAKSATFVGLTTHLSNLPTWVVLGLKQDRFDMAPVGAPPPRREPVASVRAALEIFDKNVADARAAIEDATDEHLMSPWSLLAGGKTIHTLSRYAVVRGMVINHMIHHRAQLGVYLRLNDIPVPAIYGATADEAQSR